LKKEASEKRIRESGLLGCGSGEPPKLRIVDCIMLIGKEYAPIGNPQSESQNGQADVFSASAEGGLPGHQIFFTEEKKSVRGKRLWNFDFGFRVRYNSS
jgi:hypothetical protein